jgi:hypothetical protein
MPSIIQKIYRNQPTKLRSCSCISWNDLAVMWIVFYTLVITSSFHHIEAHEHNMPVYLISHSSHHANSHLSVSSKPKTCASRNSIPEYYNKSYVFVLISNIQHSYKQKTFLGNVARKNKRSSYINEAIYNIKLIKDLKKTVYICSSCTRKPRYNW